MHHCLIDDEIVVSIIKKIDDAHFYDIKVHAMNFMNLINLIRFMSDQGRDYHFARNCKSFMECALILP